MTQKKKKTERSDRIKAMPVAPRRFTPHDMAERIRNLPDNKLINLFQFAQAYIRDTAIELDALRAPPPPEEVKSLPLKTEVTEGGKQET